MGIWDAEALLRQRGGLLVKGFAVGDTGFHETNTPSLSHPTEFFSPQTISARIFQRFNPPIFKRLSLEGADSAE